LFLGPEQGQKNFLVSKRINGKYFARDETRPPVFEIDSALVKDLKQSVSDFRSKDLVSFNRSEIDRISMQYGDSSFSCLKDSSNNWVMDDFSKSSIQSSIINSFFSNLDFITISEFVKDGNYNASAYGLLNPSLIVKLFKGEEKILEVKLGKKRNTNVYAATDQYESVYLIPQNKLDQLKLKPEEILEQPVSSPDNIPEL
jgi:hypothetical protein